MKTCPPADDLDRLLRSKLPAGPTAVLTDHIGHCSGCRERLDRLVPDHDDDQDFAAVLRDAEKSVPPTDSAYWKALLAAAAEVAVTGTFENRSFADLDLSFLQPPKTPGHLGRLGNFDVIRIVGRGGMGVVLHAYDPSLQRDIAIKVIDPQLADNELARQRFCREARAAAAVTHDNLVAVHQVKQDEQSLLPYLVMQLVPGESLDQRLKRVGKLTPAEVGRLGMQAAAGLAAAHAGGLIHRDIKPGNILLEAGTDRVKLTDFGLARAAEDVKLTRTGFVAGSPLYMSPEQARGEEIDARADLFSLGSVLYESLSGKPAFDGKTPLAVLRRVADEPHPPLRDEIPDAPEWLIETIDRLLAKDPSDRLQTASEAAELFAAGLARDHTLSPLDIPAEVCNGRHTTALRTRKARKPICWGRVCGRGLPWVAGILLGAAGMALVGGFQGTGSIDHVAAAATPALYSLPTKGGPVWALAFMPDGKGLVTGSEDGKVRVWNIQQQTAVRTLPGMTGNVWGVAVSPDGKRLAATADDSSVRLWSLTSFDTLRALPHPNATKSIAFFPDNERLVTGDRDGSIRIWNVADHEDETDTPMTFTQKGTVHSLAVSLDNRFLASGGSDSLVRIWDLDSADGKVKTAEGHEGPVYGVAFCPTGSKLASCGWDGTVRVWDATNATLLHTFTGHDGDVWAVSFGAAGRVLASAGSDGTVRIWEVATGKELRVFHGVGRGFHSVRFAPDGTTLAAGSRDGTVRIWDVNK